MNQSLIFFCLIFTLVAAYTHYVPVEENQQEEGVKDYYDPPAYRYEYSVDDRKNGVHKSHRESREGGSVSGEYSLLQPDGVVRLVKYTADDENGFQAVVSTQQS